MRKRCTILAQVNRRCANDILYRHLDFSVPLFMGESASVYLAWRTNFNRNGQFARNELSKVFGIFWNLNMSKRSNVYPKNSKNLSIKSIKCLVLESKNYTNIKEDRLYKLSFVVYLIFE
jgi:hypothetical protein